MADQPETTTETTKCFAGIDATFGTDPNEIFLELRAGSPAYIRVREGDYVQEGDAFHREQLGLNSPTLDTWEVVEIGSDVVVGRDIGSGEDVTWGREEVEKGLAIGTYSTNLTDFETVSVYEVGRWRDYDEDDPTGGGGYTYTGRPYVSVVAYGDNGLKYGRRYRFVDADAGAVELWKEDRPANGFADGVRDRLDDRVREALEADGYTLAE